MSLNLKMYQYHFIFSSNICYDIMIVVFVRFVYFLQTRIMCPVRECVQLCIFIRIRYVQTCLFVPIYVHGCVTVANQTWKMD